MRAVRITWRAGTPGLAVREIVGKEVDSEMVRCALSETCLGLEHI